MLFHNQAFYHANAIYVDYYQTERKIYLNAE